MPSLFRQVWACCLRSRSPSPVVDERTHLIQPIHDEPSPLPPSIVTDHQKLRERLDTIVRSKEGKMINVGTPLPFNLHNRALHARVDPSGSASSRSGHRSQSGSSGRRPTADAGVEQERSTSRASSVQPSNPSMTSLQPYLQQEEHEGYDRRPILNIRLASDSSVRTRQGRSRGRLGRFGEERGREIKPRNCIVHDTSQDEFAEGRSSPSAPSSLESLSKNDLPPTQEPSTTEDNFKIKDVGVITRSWRD